MQADPIRIEETINASIEKIWSALTNPEEMAQWYFELPKFEAEEGFQIHFTSCDLLHRWVITKVIPHHIIEYKWSYPDYPGESFLSIELLYMNEYATKIVLEHKGVESFPQENPNFTRESFEQGWNEIFKNLHEYVDETVG
jgi:uncharacterized protein YndB with AHSA1/START domain